MSTTVATFGSIKQKLIGALLLPIIGFTILLVVHWQHASEDLRGGIIAVGVIAILLMVLFALYAYQSWSLANYQMANTLSDVIISSDLKVRCSSTTTKSNPAAAALNRLLEHLQSQINDLNDVANGLCRHSTDLIEICASSDVSVKTQLSETQQVADSIEQINLAIEEVARNAGAASEIATEADHNAHEGKVAVDGVMQSVKALAEEVENSVQVVKVLNEETVRIGSVLDVIRGIAEQTNLLALNAAIEAARAGDQGRGFAVVADEVRTLANRTQQSTQEINSMIERLQAGVRSAVAVMGRGQDLAIKSIDKAEAASKVITTITSAVTSISSMNGQIANAVEEQTVMIREVSNSMLSIQEASAKTSQGADQVTVTSTRLKQKSQDLQMLLSEFRT